MDKFIFGILLTLVASCTSFIREDVITENVCRPCKGSSQSNFDHSLFQHGRSEKISSLLGAFVDRINDVKEKINTSLSSIVRSYYGGDVGYLCFLRMAGDSDIPTPTLSHIRQINPLTKTYNQLATLALYISILNSDVIRSCDMDYSHLIGTLPLCHWKQILRHLHTHLPHDYCQKSFPVDGVTSCSTAVDLVYVILESARGMLSVLESRGNIYKSLVDRETSPIAAFQTIINSHIL